MKPAWQAWAGLAARLVLGAVLIGAGASKTAAPPEEFAVVIESYDVMPVDLAQSASVFMPWLELALGFALLFGYFTKYSGAGAGVLLTGFLLALGSTKLRGIELPNCGCFGSSFHMPIWMTLAMDTLLLGGAALASSFGERRLSLDKWMRAGYTDRDAR